MSVRDGKKGGMISGERLSQAKPRPRNRNGAALQGGPNRYFKSAIQPSVGTAIPSYTVSRQSFQSKGSVMGSTRLTYVNVMTYSMINELVVQQMADGIGMQLAIGKCQQDIHEAGFGSTLDSEYYYKELRPRMAPIDPQRLPIYLRVVQGVRDRMDNDYKLLSIHQQKEISAIEAINKAKRRSNEIVLGVIDSRIDVNLSRNLKSLEGENYRASARWHHLLVALAKESALMTKDLSSDCVWLIENLVWNHASTSVEELVNYMGIIYDTLAIFGTTYPDIIKIRQLCLIVGPRDPDYKALCSGFKLYPDMTYNAAVMSFKDAEGDVIKRREHKHGLLRAAKSDLQRSLSVPPTKQERDHTASAQQSHFAKQDALLREIATRHQSHQARDDGADGYDKSDKRSKSQKMPKSWSGKSHQATIKHKDDRGEGPCEHTFVNGSLCGMPHPTMFHKNSFRQMGMDPAIQPGHSAKGQRSFQDTYRKEVKPRGNLAVSKHTRFQILDDGDSSDDDDGNMARAHMSIANATIPDIASLAEDEQYDAAREAMDALRFPINDSPYTTSYPTAMKSNTSSAGTPRRLPGTKSAERKEEEKILRELTATDLARHMWAADGTMNYPTTPQSSGFDDAHLYSQRQHERSDIHRQQAMALRELTNRNERLEDELNNATIRRNTDRIDHDESSALLVDTNLRVERSNILLHTRIQLMESALDELTTQLSNLENHMRTRDSETDEAQGEVDVAIQDLQLSNDQLSSTVEVIRLTSANMMTTLNDVSIRVDARTAASTPTRNPHHTRSRGSILPTPVLRSPRGARGDTPTTHSEFPAMSLRSHDDSFDVSNPLRDPRIGATVTIASAVDTTIPTFVEDSTGTTSVQGVDSAVDEEGDTTHCAVQVSFSSLRWADMDSDSSSQATEHVAMHCVPGYGMYSEDESTIRDFTLEGDDDSSTFSTGAESMPTLVSMSISTSIVDDSVDESIHMARSGTNAQANELIIDSGATRDMVTSELGAISSAPVSKRTMSLGGLVDHTFNVTSIVDTKHARRALCVPDLATGLISVSQRDREGMTTIFTQGRAFIYDREGTIVMSATRMNKLYEVDDTTDTQNIINVLDVTIR